MWYPWTPRRLQPINLSTPCHHVISSTTHLWPTPWRQFLIQTALPSIPVRFSIFFTNEWFFLVYISIIFFEYPIRNDILFQNMWFYTHNLKRLHIYGWQCFAKSISLIIEIPVKVCRYRALIRLLTLSTSLPCRLFWFVDFFTLSTYLPCQSFHSVDLFTQSTFLLWWPFSVLSRPFHSVDLFTQ